MQGATWAYDFTFGSTPAFMQLCAQLSVEYIPFLVRVQKVAGA